MTYNVYRVWVRGQKEATLCTLEATSKFDARLKMAGRFGCKTYQIEAIRNRKD